MPSLLLNPYPLLARWATSITPLQQNQGLSDGVWAHSPTSVSLRTLHPLMFLAVSEMGCLSFSLPCSESPPPLSPGSSILVMPLLLHLQSSSPHWLILFYLQIPHSTPSKKLESKKYLPPKSQSTWLAFLPTQTSFWNCLPPRKMLWMFILTWFYLCGKKKARVHSAFPGPATSLGYHNQSLSPIESFFIVSCICLCCLFLLPLSLPWPRSLSPQT